MSWSFVAPSRNKRGVIIALAHAGSELHSGERGLRGRGSRVRLQGREDNERGGEDNQHLVCQHVVILYNTLTLGVHLQRQAGAAYGRVYDSSGDEL